MRTRTVRPVQIRHQGISAQGGCPMGRGELGAIVEFPARRALALPLAAIPGGQAVLEAQAWDGRGGSRWRDVLTRTGRQQTGDEQAAQERVLGQEEKVTCLHQHEKSATTSSR